eukprot:4660472-Alexandrium_andersonii.AAC.1
MCSWGGASPGAPRRASPGSAGAARHETRLGQLRLRMQDPFAVVAPVRIPVLQRGELLARGGPGRGSAR